MKSQQHELEQLDWNRLEIDTFSKLGAVSGPDPDPMTDPDS